MRQRQHLLIVVASSLALATSCGDAAAVSPDAMTGADADVTERSDASVDATTPAPPPDSWCSLPERHALAVALPFGARLNQLAVSAGARTDAVAVGAVSSAGDVTNLIVGYDRETAASVEVVRLGGAWTLDSLRNREANVTVLYADAIDPRHILRARWDPSMERARQTETMLTEGAIATLIDTGASADVLVQGRRDVSGELDIALVSWDADGDWTETQIMASVEVSERYWLEGAALDGAAVVLVANDDPTGFYPAGTVLWLDAMGERRAAVTLPRGLRVERRSLVVTPDGGALVVGDPETPGILQVLRVSSERTDSEVAARLDVTAVDGAAAIARDAVFVTWVGPPVPFGDPEERRQDVPLYVARVDAVRGSLAGASLPMLTGACSIAAIAAVQEGAVIASDCVGASVDLTYACLESP